MNSGMTTALCETGDGMYMIPTVKKLSQIGIHRITHLEHNVRNELVLNSSKNIIYAAEHEQTQINERSA